MKDEIEALFTDLRSKDDDARSTAFNRLIEITDNEVDWFEEKFDELAGKLNDENSYQ